MIRKSLLLLCAAVLLLPASGFSQLDTSLPWPKFHHDIKNTGKTQNFGTLIGGLKWEYQTGGPVTSSPALDDDTLYIGSADNYFYALDQADGSLKWRVKTDAPIQRSSPAIDEDGIVYIGSDDGFLYAIDTDPAIAVADVNDAIERIVDSFPTAGAINSSPNIDADNNVLFASNDGYIYSVRLVAGTLIQNWRTEIGASWSSPAICSASERVYIGSIERVVIPGDTFGSNLFSINRNTGAFDWGFPNDIDPVDPVCSSGGMYSSPVITPDGRLLAAFFTTWRAACDSDSDLEYWNYNFLKLNRNIGTPVWLLELDGEDLYSTPAVLEDNSIFIPSGPNLYRVLPDMAIYYTVATVGGRIESSPAIDNRKTIYVGSNGGFFYAIGADSPETPILWQYPREGDPPLQTGAGSIASIISSPAIGADAKRSVYVGASDGKVYAFYDSPRISGNVTYKGQPLSNVTITLQGGGVTKTETTNDAGWYEYKDGLAYDVAYTITPSRDGYLFTPASSVITLTAADDDQTANFTARRYEITGKVVGTDGNPIQGITVRLTGAGIADEKSTNSDGEYKFEDLIPGPYTVAAISSGYRYTPAEITVSNLDSDRTLGNIVATAVTGLTISGKIVNAETKLGIEEMEVELTGDGGYVGDTTQTDSSGHYFFTGLDSHTYNVIPTSTDEYLFDPSKIVIEDMQEDQDNQNFEATPLTGLTISGKVRDSATGLGVNNITIELSGDGGFTTTTTTTGTDGSYAFTGLAQRSYNVRPTSAGFVYSPTVIDVQDLSSDKMDADFEATPLTGLTISGKIRDSITGLGIEGIEVELTGDGGFDKRTATTNSRGDYRFPGLDRRSYFLQPVTGGYKYVPEGYRFPDLIQDETDANFTASSLPPTISGSITDGITGDGVSGVAVLLFVAGVAREDRETGETINLAATTTTDGNGFYEFVEGGEVELGKSYDVVPQHTEYSFEPSERSVTLRPEGVSGINFRVLRGLQISGRVTDSGTGAGIAGIRVNLSGGGLDTFRTTDANGNYIFPELERGEYTITPHDEKYSFEPVSRTVALDDKSVGNVNFSGLRRFEIAGRVRDDQGRGIKNITVNIIKVGYYNAAITDVNGAYRFDNLERGEYTVYPVSATYDFKPVSTTVTISTKDLTGVNFAGSIPVDFPLADTPWPKFHYDLKNTGKTNNFGTLVGDLKWKFQTGGAVTSSPALSHDTLYVGSADNYFYALNTETGELRWRYKTGGAISFSSPAIDRDGVVFIGSNDGYLYAFDTINIDTLNPAPLWRFRTNGAISSSPSFEGSNVVFASNDGYFYAVDRTTGSEVWRRIIGSSWVSPAVDGRIYAGSWNPVTTNSGTFNFFSMNENGSVEWGFPTFCIPGGMLSSPVIAFDGGIIVSYFTTADDCDDDLSDYNIFKIDITGNTRWALDLGGNNIYSTPAVLEDNSMFIASGNQLYRILPDASTYYSVATVGDRIESSPAIDGRKTVYVGSNGGYFYAIGADSPETPILWQYPRAGDPPLQTAEGSIASIISSPAIGAGRDDRNSVYVGASDGCIYAFFDGSRIVGKVELVQDGANVPLSGVKIILKNDTDPGMPDKETLTDPNGFFEFTGVNENFTYTLIPEKIGYIFNPLSQTVTVRQVGDVNVLFQASSGKTLSGSVTDTDGKFVAGVNISLEGTRTGYRVSQVTDSNGKYEFTGLGYDTYTITPSLTGYGFTPPFRSVVIASTDAADKQYENIDFVATVGFQISGRVIDAVKQEGFPGVRINIRNAEFSDSTITDESGAYSFVGLEPGTYTLTPQFSTYDFEPPNRTIVLAGANVDNVDFVAGRGANLSGLILDKSSKTPLKEVEVGLYDDRLFGDPFANSPVRTSRTDDVGAFNFVGVEPNRTYYIKPSKEGYGFEPSYIRRAVVGPVTMSDLYFEAVEGLFISGTVANMLGAGISDMEVSLSGEKQQTVQTNARGQYSFSALGPGNYTVSVEANGYRAHPASQNVIISTSGRDDVNFTLSMQCPHVLFNLPFYGGTGTIVNIFGMNFGMAPPMPPQNVNVGGVTLEEGVYFGGTNPNTWVKADVIDWSPIKVAVRSPASSFAFPLVHVWVVRLDETTGEVCYYEQPFILNFYISGW